MRFLIPFLLLAPLKAEEFYARITFYNDKVDAQGRAPIRGKTVAAAKKWKFGTKFHIPALRGIVGDGNFVCSDRGRDVESRRASRGKLEIIDVYVSKNEIKRLATTKKFHKVLVKVDEDG